MEDPSIHTVTVNLHSKRHNLQNSTEFLILHLICRGDFLVTAKPILHPWAFYWPIYPAFLVVRCEHVTWLMEWKWSTIFSGEVTETPHMWCPMLSQKPLTCDVPCSHRDPSHVMSHTLRTLLHVMSNALRRPLTRDVLCSHWEPSHVMSHALFHF